ncbi:MAG: HD-GYP domain-containing protein [Gemmatimonadota bacterium]
MREKGRPSGSGRIVALVSGQPDLDAPVHEALADVDAEVEIVHEPEAVLDLVAGGETDLVLADEAAVDPGSLHARLAEKAESAPPFLAILAAGGDAALRNADSPALVHFLARPFRSETLSALAWRLIERGRRGAGTHSGRALQGRRPARFSARPLYADAVGFARDAFERARDGKPPHMDRARLLAERIHTSLLQSNLLLNRALEPYKRFEIPTHCANVAIFGAKIALGLEWPLERTLQVIQAGLLHDLGMARLPGRILARTGPLSDEERGEMQSHPILGAELVTELGGGYDWLERAVRQEHERAHGRGYPEGRAGGEIDPIARVLGVADVFEAFSHARDYRSPFTAFEALEKVMAMRAESFDPQVVDALANEISVFPLDSYVQLSTGAIGRVVATNPENLMRPTVEVLWNATWAPLDEPEMVALEALPEVTIERPLHESEVPIT